MSMEGLKKHGVRIALDAEEFIGKHSITEEELLSLEKKFISAEDLQPILKKREEEKEIKPEATKAEVSLSPDFSPAAKEYSPEIKVRESLDVTGKSRTEGGVNDFVDYFRNRYERLSALLRTYSGKYPEADLEGISRLAGQKIRAIVMVSEIRETKKGNILLQVEDLTGQFKVVISQRDEQAFEKARNIVNDDVILIYGKVAQAFIIAEDFEWPDLRVTREKKKPERDLAAVYLSDLHFGSKQFLGDYFNRFTDWIAGKGENTELAGKVKYVFVAGDIVDGIGIYPNQEKDLDVLDIFKQYELFSGFVQELPDYLEVIVCPGNHDAVRRAEPMPALPKDILGCDVLSLGSPSTLCVENTEHLLYHGTSSDSWIASLSHLSYDHPEKVMAECLKRRHLSPMFGGNAVVPEKLDYMVIENEPDVVHFGHVHKNGYMRYRDSLIINSGTFQDTTDFQQKQGHIPTPAKVPIYEFMQERLRTLDFTR
ncbi:DNA polymerase II small subunit [Candidatus Micrarchaeota archaeon]|nr:DNA polymerase II small subunit [Candidatus Micrarchaeota archaeon]MBD3417641.1 DNA polymerase II small subunit [Candidatus Micrarchaeota archaeon]